MQGSIQEDLIGTRERSKNAAEDKKKQQQKAQQLDEEAAALEKDLDALQVCLCVAMLILCSATHTPPPWLCGTSLHS